MSIPDMEIPADRVVEFLRRLAHMPKDWESEHSRVYDHDLWEEFKWQHSEVRYSDSDYYRVSEPIYDACLDIAGVAEHNPDYSYSEAAEIFNATLAYLYAEAWGLDIDFS